MDVTPTLLLAGCKRRHDRLVQQQRNALVVLQTAREALQASEPIAPGDGPTQGHALALAMVINTISAIEAGEKTTTFAEEIASRLEKQNQDPGRPKMPFSPARGALGCLAVACMFAVSAAIVFSAMGLLWNDPWRFMWAAIALGAGSILVWAALYRRSYNRKGRDS